MATKTKLTTPTAQTTQAELNLGPNFDAEGYRRLVGSSPMAIAVHIKGVVAYANAATAELMGVKDAKDLVGENVMDYVHPDSQDIVRKRVAILYQEGKQHTDIIEEKLIRGDGEIIHVEIASLLFQYEGQAAIQLFLRDITERQHDREALMQAKAEAEVERQRLHDLFMQAPACIAMLRGPDHVFELANPMYMDLVGPNRRLLGRPVIEAFPEVVDQGFVELLDNVYRTGKPYLGREQMVRFNQKYKTTEETVYLNFVYQPSHDADGKVDGILVHAVDVTDQVLARQEVEYKNSLMTTITDNATLGLFMLDDQQRCTFMNHAAEAITGFTFKEIEGRRLHDFLHHTRSDGKPYPIEECPIDRAMPHNHRQQGEENFIHKDGTFYPLRFTASPIMQDGKRVGTVIEAQDLTEEKRARAALVESEERFRQLADSMPQMVWTADAKGKIDYRNKQWQPYASPKSETFGAAVWRNSLHPDDYKRVMQSWTDSVMSGTPYEIEYRMKDVHNPGKYRWFLGRAVPVRDSSGNITKWFGTSTDIDDIRRTDQRKKELEQITVALTEQRTQLVALNKAKDEFISLASHQLRTPATGVKQYIGMVLDGFAGELTPELRTFLEKAYESNERQITIVNDLLQVAQVDAGKVKLNHRKTDLVELIKKVINEQSSRFTSRNQTVSFKPGRATLSIHADTERLRMVMDNLIDNASKYTPTGKSIEITLSRSADTVQVAIRDEGVGIAPGDVDMIFRKFSRLDNPLSAHVGGSGLGLYWAQKIIDLHHGTIQVDSVVDKGSTFTVTLPM